MNRTEIEKISQATRKQLQSIYTDIQSYHNPMLPTPDATVELAGKLINQEQYDVVVCGEIKKGKSTFINALMGDDILPTNTEVATSQVFRIINSDEESYALIFNDGQRISISRDELSRYGSQVDADLYGNPQFKGHQLEYIEVKHPIPFLPQNVAIVDTPGIGALYSAHELITRNYLSNAAAIIFITDPQNPITTIEKEFVERAIKVTRQIMFILTKMDNYSPDYIRSLVVEDERILAPLAQSTATKRISVYPMSSKTLNLATRMNNEQLVEKSQFDIIRDALLRLVYSTIDFEVNARVFNIFNQHHNRVMKVLNDIHKSATNPEQALKLVEQKRKKQQELTATWGSNGSQQQKIMIEVEDEIIGLRNRVNEMLSLNYSIYSDMLQRIEDLSTCESAERLSRSMSSCLERDYGNRWKSLLCDCQESINAILMKYNYSLGSMLEDESIVQIESYHHKELTLAGHLNNFRASYFSGSIVAGVGMAVAGIASAFAAPVVAGIAVIAGIFGGIFAGREVGKENKLNQWKQNLKIHLTNCYTQAREALIVKPSKGNLTELQDAEYKIREASRSAITALFNQHKDDIERQIKAIDEQVNADNATRQQKLVEIEKIKSDWTPVHIGLKNVRESLIKLEQAHA